MEPSTTLSKGALWTGRIISALVILFLLVDAIMKVFKTNISVEGSVQLGWPEHLVITIGVILLIATILYIIPATAGLGALLITAYLGGAVAIMMRAGAPFAFPIIFGVLTWAGIYLREPRIRGILLLR